MVSCQVLLLTIGYNIFMEIVFTLLYALFIGFYDVFKKLSVSAGIQRSLVENDAKGTLTITRIQSIDTDTWDVSLMLFGQHTEYADKIKDFVVIPHVRTGRDSDEVTAILRFEIVEPNFTTVSVDA